MTTTALSLLSWHLCHTSAHPPPPPPEFRAPSRNPLLAPGILRQHSPIRDPQGTLALKGPVASGRTLSLWGPRVSVPPLVRFPGKWCKIPGLKRPSLQTGVCKRSTLHGALLPLDKLTPYSHQISGRGPGVAIDPRGKSHSASLCHC